RHVPNRELVASIARGQTKPVRIPGQGSVWRRSGGRVASDVTVLAVDSCDDGVGRTRNDGTDDRRNPEEPQLSWRTVAVEERHAGRASWIDGGVVDRDRDEVNQGQTEPDSARGKD